MKENKNNGKTPAQHCLYSSRKMRSFFFSIHSLGLIYAQRREKLQKYLNYLQYRKGILGKITKTWSKEQTFSHCAKILHGVKISHPSAKLLDFPAFSALLSLWFMICNAEFDSNSMCLDD